MRLVGEIEKRLRAARHYADLTAKAFAVHLETSVDTVGRIENGSRSVDADKDRYMLERAAAATTLPVAFFTADFARLDGRLSTPRGEGSTAALEREIRRLRDETEAQRRSHERQVETLRRSLDSSKGRLTRIERNLHALGEAVLPASEDA